MCTPSLAALAGFLQTKHPVFLCSFSAYLLAILCNMGGLVVLWEYMDHLAHSFGSYDYLPGTIGLATA